MPKQQDRSASTAKANSQPDQANASSNAAASKDSEILSYSKAKSGDSRGQQTKYGQTEP